MIQTERFPSALDGAAAKLDDRTLAELLDEASGIASLVPYVGIDGARQGVWADLLGAEPTILLSSIVAVDIRRFERRLLRFEQQILAAADWPHKRGAFVRFWDTLLELPRQVDRWHRSLRLAPTTDLAQRWRYTIDRAIAIELRPIVQRMQAYDRADAALGAPLGLDFSTFAPIWELAVARPPAGAGGDADVYVGDTPAERVDRALPHAWRLWHPLALRVSGWSALARPELGMLDTGGATMEPHVAMVVAFARLFATAQDALNGIGARRTDFYYRQRLLEHNRPAVPDRVHVAFSVAPVVTPQAIVVPAGTRLSAGQDAGGRAIEYKTDAAITVTSAALARVLTLHVAHGSATVGPVDVAGAAGSVNTARLPQQVLAREIAPSPTWQGPWATFGRPDDPPAALGFAVSSPVLRLAGGDRTVTVTVRHAALPEAVEKALQGIATRLGVDRTAALSLVIREGFEPSVSVAGGWYPVDGYEARPDASGEAHAWAVQFTLPASAPPLVANTAEAGATVRFVLRTMAVPVSGPLGRARVYPLAILGPMRVLSVRADVSVSGLTDLRIANTDGPVDVSAPFPAFGALPVAGATLRIAADELFAKPVDQFAIRVTWFDLPSNRSGFRGYYRHYVVDADGAVRGRLFDNQSFRLVASVEGPGTWTLAPHASGEQFVYRTVNPPAGHAGVQAPAEVIDAPDPDGQLSETTTFGPWPTTDLGDAPTGSAPSDGAIRLELVQPPYGYGQSLYAANMLHAVLNDAPPGMSRESACRASYAVIAESRRRLDDLLAAGGYRRADEVLLAISPAPWPRRAVRRLRTALQDVGGSLRSTVSRRPGLDEETGWIVRNEVDDLGDGLTTENDRSYQRQVLTTVRGTVATLLEVASGSLAASLGGEDSLDAAAWRGWQARLADAGKGSQSRRLAALRACLSDLRASGADVTSPEFRKCDAVLHAASMVHDCDPHAEHLDARYSRTVRDNIKTCVVKLQALYDESVKTCTAAPAARATPNPPHLPRIAAIAVDYRSGATASLTHLLPFGGRCDQAIGPDDTPTLLPFFANAGALILGFTGLQTPSVLRLHLRLTAAARDVALPDVGWEVLQGQQWVRLVAPHAELDTTEGLRQTGTVVLALPPLAALPSTLLPGERLWLRAVVRGDAESFAATVNLMLHAVTATRHLIDGREDVSRPIAAGAVVGITPPIKGIAGIKQPGPSFGGRPAEDDRAFATRISERLRHKNRAVSRWDIERVVLERFPDVFRAGVLRARRRRPGDRVDAGPGYVRVMVVPEPTCPDITDMSAPRMSHERLRRIEASLADAIVGTATVRVSNAMYVRLRVTAAVQWRPGVEPAAAARRLDAVLRDQLSPWRESALAPEAWPPAAFASIIRAQPDVVDVVSVAVDAAPDAAEAEDPDLAVAVSAAAHVVDNVNTAATVAAEGY